MVTEGTFPSSIIRLISGLNWVTSRSVSKGWTAGLPFARRNSTKIQSRKFTKKGLSLIPIFSFSDFPF
jgi:hypothetical protein